MLKKCKIIITFMHYNTFLEKMLNIVIKQSCESRMRWMEVQKGQFRFHTFNWTFKICSSLTLIHEKYANMADLVKLRTKVSEVIFNKLW